MMIRGIRFKGFNHLVTTQQTLNTKNHFAAKLELAKSKYKTIENKNEEEIDTKLKNEYTPFIADKVAYEKLKAVQSPMKSSNLPTGIF